MLLVDDHQAEPVKSNGVLHERVRADDEVCRAARQFRQHVAPPRRRDAAA